MSLPSHLYPATPNPVPTDLTQPSPEFRREVKKVLGSIIWFMIEYLLLVAFGAALAAGCFYVGYLILTNFRGSIPILLAVGVAGMGIMIFIFLVKFIFSVSRIDRSGSVEITDQDQPELFAFIRQVAADTQAPFPKKIFISSDVNASVSYDSSFWSMFFPVRKNLTIGLGLVNSLNLSEFKAVMAHEFGHFSQRSMKLGSYVYNVNRILHNMLYDNSGFSRLLSGFANASSVFAFFAEVTVSIARGIQTILTKTYERINKRYSGLSLQMEFHADAVAASVSGSDALASALHRIEMAFESWQMGINQCEKLISSNKRAGNFFPIQQHCAQIIAADNKLQLENGLPVISDDYLQQRQVNRVIVKDQWASHPPTEDRVRALKGYGIAAGKNTNSAWALFRDVENLQAELTRKIYGDVVDNTVIEEETADYFVKSIDEERRMARIPEYFNGFYDARSIAAVTVEELNQMRAEEGDWDDVYNHNVKITVQKLQALSADINLLQQIIETKDAVKSFDFDGKKYDASEAATVMEQLNQETATLQAELKEADLRCIRFGLYLSQRKNGSEEVMRSEYREYFRNRTLNLEMRDRAIAMMQPWWPMFSGHEYGADSLTEIRDEHRQKQEPKLKEDIRTLMAKNAFDFLDRESIDRLNNFLLADYVYFTGEEIISEEIVILDKIAGYVIEASTRLVMANLHELLSKIESYRTPVLHQ